MTQRVRRLDANNDITFGHGRRDYSSGAESTAQRLRCRMRHIVGEWFLDTEAGTPWIQPEGSETRPIMGGPADLGYAEAVLRARILSTDGVAGISRFAISLDHETRRMLVEASGPTVDGDVWNIREVSPQ